MPRDMNPYHKQQDITQHKKSWVFESCSMREDGV